MKLKSINPATEEIFGEVEGVNFEYAVAAVKACAAAQIKWRGIFEEKRSALLKKLAEILRGGLNEYAKIMTLEMGKPIAQARAEVEKCAWLCDFYAENAEKFLAPEAIKTEARKSYVRFDPLGVVLCIMPWNFPFWQVFRFAVPALAAGNGAILKHASNVPQCAIAIGKIFEKAAKTVGAPVEIFRALLIDSDTASQLIELPKIAAVSLTGSTEAGAKVAEIAGKNLKKCVLELGGSDPFIVLADADIDAAASAALQARTINTGQSCIAAKRFILEAPIAEKFTQQITELFKTLKMGDPMNESVNIGPLAKMEIRSDLERQVNDAIKKGAKMLAGGKRAVGKGFFFEPTLLTNVTENMAVYREETFGPVMTLFTVKNSDAALNLANESEFGLGASIWTKNLELAEKMAAKIEGGFVAINSMVKSDPRLPFGGIKRSGFGRELGSFGIREFVNIKSVMV